MSTTLTFNPIPDSDHQFGTAQIRLSTQNEVYVVGFRRNSIFSFGSVEGEPGFSDELVEGKLCIVPADSMEARKLKEIYAAIWLAPGYKVMLLPAEGSKIFYQRAIPENPKWRRIKTGYGFDLADPLMTVLDNGIHIKFDSPPDRPKGDELLRRVLRFLSHSRDAKARGIPGFRSLVRHVHTEIEGNEVHDGGRRHQIAARVNVRWGGYVAEGWKRMPSMGLLTTVSEDVLEDANDVGVVARGVIVETDMDVDKHGDEHDGVDEDLERARAFASYNRGKDDRPHSSPIMDPRTSSRPAPTRSKSNTTTHGAGPDINPSRSSHSYHKDTTSRDVSRSRDQRQRDRDRSPDAHPSSSSHHSTRRSSRSPSPNTSPPPSPTSTSTSTTQTSRSRSRTRSPIPDPDSSSDSSSSSNINIAHSSRSHSRSQSPSSSSEDQDRSRTRTARSLSHDRTRPAPSPKDSYRRRRSSKSV